MLLTSRLRELIDAGFSGFEILTRETDEAVAEVMALARQEGYRVHGEQGGVLSTEPGPNFDPYTTITEFTTHDDPTPALLLLPSFGRFLSDPNIIQMIYRAIQNGKKCRRYIVMFATTLTVPAELESMVQVIEHDLPDREQLHEIAKGIATEPGEMPEGVELVHVLDAAAGLTRYEAEGAFSLSIIRKGKIDAATVFNLKAQAIEKSGLATIWKGDETVDDLGGLAQIKKRLRMAGNVTGRWRPKGIILVGQPGTGKSHIAKSAGRILNRPVVSASLARLKGQYVGETGKNTRRLLSLIRAIGPCVVVLDEGNQQLGGGAERHETTEEMIGELLTFLNDQQDAYFILTANEIKSIPDPLTRPGRFDAVFFVDLPTADQRAEIWAIHLAKYGLPADTPIPDCDGWTGAEIEEACKAAAMYGPQGLSLHDAAAWVLPISVRQSEAIEARRQWAVGKCFDANNEGPYSRTRPPEVGRRALKRKNDLD